MSCGYTFSYPTAAPSTVVRRLRHELLSFQSIAPQKWLVYGQSHEHEPCLRGFSIQKPANFWLAVNSQHEFEHDFLKIVPYSIILSGWWWFGTMEFYDIPYFGNFIIPTPNHRIGWWDNLHRKTLYLMVKTHGFRVDFSLFANPLIQLTNSYLSEG